MYLAASYMNYFYNRSSSIFFIASEYCVHPQDGIMHLPRFRRESLLAVS